MHTLPDALPEAHGGEQCRHVGRDIALDRQLLGHRRHSTTAEYTHLADIQFVETAEKVGSIIAEAMNIRTVLPPPRPRDRDRGKYGR